MNKILELFEIILNYYIRFAWYEDYKINLHLVIFKLSKSYFYSFRHDIKALGSLKNLEVLITSLSIFFAKLLT